MSTGPWRAILTRAPLILIFAANIIASASLPLSDRLLKRRFPQVELGDCSVPLSAFQRGGSLNSRILKSGNITLHTGTDALLFVEGADRDGKAWRVTLRNQPAGCSAWHADLDRNGQEDIIIATFNPLSNGKDVNLTIIMLDDRKRPVPWQAPGYFDVDEHGIRDLLDLNQDGRAELAYLHLEGDQFEGRQSSLSLYKAGHAYWNKISGQFAGLRFPIRRPARATFSEEPNLSNAPVPRKMGLKIASLQQGIRSHCGVLLPLDPESSSPRVDTTPSEDLGETCYGFMTLSDGRRLRFPEMLVIDGADGREMAIGDTGSLLDKAAKQKLSVQVVGTAADSEGRPFLLWAEERLR